MKELTDKLDAYLRVKLAAPDLIVADLARIPGGASRETYRFRARYVSDGKPIDRGLILRRDPPASLIETERTPESRAYEAFHRRGLPVPEPIALELGGAALERPFFIMAEVENCTAGGIMSPEPYGEHRQKVGEQFYTVMGKIAAANPNRIGLGDFE